LDNPDLVEENGLLAFASAIWFYMTPDGVKPSMHDVITKFWAPNAHEISQGINPGFGTTVAIINGEEECGLGWDHTVGATRYWYYQQNLSYFGLFAGEPGQSCA